MVNIAGTNIPINVDISGFISSSWIWVLLVVILGGAIIITISLLLFFRTYNRKYIIFENISGQGYQPSQRGRARILKLGPEGAEVLKTQFGGTYITAYGRKMGKNTYWFVKGPDGFLYNVLLGDFDAKQGMLDIEPVDRDVRMQNKSIAEMARSRYQKKDNLVMWVLTGVLVFSIILSLIGNYLIWGKIQNTLTTLQPNADQQTKISAQNLQTAEDLKYVSDRLGTSNVNLTGVSGSGLVPAG